MRNHFPGEGPSGPHNPYPDEDIDLVEIESEPPVLPGPVGDGGPAFPRPMAAIYSKCLEAEGGSEGMTLRDWFAGQALAGLVKERIDSFDAAQVAYIIADFMLCVRKGGKDAPRNPA